MNKEKITKFAKIFLLIYMSLTFINILLPDEFVIGIVKLDYRLDPFQMIIRWFNFVGFLVLPIAVYFDRPTFKKIALYFCLPVVIILMCMFKDILPGYMSELGTGIVDIRYLPEAVSNFMHNGIFRGILFFTMCITEIITIILVIAKDWKVIKFNKKDVINFAILLPILIASIVPTYALEGIFDHQSNIKFKTFSIAHIIWMLFIVAEIIVIYKLFKNRSHEDRLIVVLILALDLLVQYNQLFSSLGELTCKRMPLQLCNLASYLILVAIIFKRRDIFIFNLLINVVGAIIAVIVLDADNSNLISKGNIHYIVEHNNVIVVPILCLLLGVFEPVKKGEFKIFLKYFTIYFMIIYILGTTFNALYLALDSDFFKCNYLFMFDAVKAQKLLPFTKYLFDLKITIGYVNLYPAVQLPIYAAFTGLSYLTYIVLLKAFKKKADIQSA